MSKLVSDLVEEFHSIDEIEDDFEFFIMSIVIDDDGEIESTPTLTPVSHIEVDETHQECLFHSDAEKKTITISDAIKEVSSLDSEFQLVSTENNIIAASSTVDDSTTRTDNPIIGFGENIEKRQFFLVCQTFENISVLH